MRHWQGQHADKTLGDNEIHIWLNFLNAHQARIKHLYPLLTSKEKQRSEQFKFYKHRKAFIASHGFLHTVLSYYTQTAADEIEFSYGPQGKPSIIEAQNPTQLTFNLSHSHNLAILAICKQHAVGIDIESSQRENDWCGISKRFFTASEQQKLFSLPENQQQDAFFQIWTRKEAHMKVTGQGLSLSPTQFEVSVPPEPAAFIASNTNNAKYFKMQDIILPTMYSDNYFSCLSSDFNFQMIKYYMQS